MFYTTISVNLKEIEKTRKWLEYNNNGDNLEVLITLSRINKLYKKIEEITGEMPNLNETNFTMSDIELSLAVACNYYLNHIEIVDVLKMGQEKLTDEEKKLCESIMLSCTYENSDQIMEKVSLMDNFYLKSYTEELLLKDPRSNYKYSFNVISKGLRKATEKVDPTVIVLKPRNLSKDIRKDY